MCTEKQKKKKKTAKRGEINEEKEKLRGKEKRCNDGRRKMEKRTQKAFGG